MVYFFVPLHARVKLLSWMDRRICRRAEGQSWPYFPCWRILPRRHRGRSRGSWRRVIRCRYSVCDCEDYWTFTILVVHNKLHDFSRALLIQPSGSFCSPNPLSPQDFLTPTPPLRIPRSKRSGVEPKRFHTILQYKFLGTVTTAEFGSEQNRNITRPLTSRPPNRTRMPSGETDPNHAT